MSFILNLFRSPPPPTDYSTILATLAATIATRQQALADIRARERRATTLVTLYALAGWLIYLGVWYFGFVSSSGGRRVKGVERAVRALPVFVGPIFILFIRRIVQVWYNRKGNAEEKTLAGLLKEQRAKVEEIKKKTNFYETRDLLSRYDAAGGSAPSTPQQTPQRPAANGPRKSVGPSAAASASSTGPSTRFPNQQQPQQPPPQAPSGPPQRKWFDALADLLVGEDASQQDKERQKYALICGKCFAHNGLVPEAVWADAQYACPKCGFFNASVRSRGGSAIRAGGMVSPTSPTSPMSPNQMSPAQLAAMASGAGSRLGGGSVGGGQGQPGAAPGPWLGGDPATWSPFPVEPAGSSARAPSASARRRGKGNKSKQQQQGSDEGGSGEEAMEVDS